MKLNELTRDYPFDKNVIDIASKTLPTYNTFSLYEKLKSRGWFKIGNESSYSDVFTNVNYPYILKINRRVDRAFAWFAFLTRKFQNIHFPRVSNMKVISIPGKTKYDKPEKFNLYLIEKLQEITNNQSRSWKEDTKIFSSYISGYVDISVLQQTNSDIGREETFIDALNILRENKKNFGVDLHYENLMKRADGTIVIIDPYSP